MLSIANPGLFFYRKRTPFGKNGVPAAYLYFKHQLSVRGYGPEILINNVLQLINGRS